MTTHQSAHVAVLEALLQEMRDRALVADWPELSAWADRIADLMKQSSWIAVSELLPEMDRPVWLVDASGHVWIGARGDTGDGWLWGNAYDSLYRDVAGNIESSDNEADDDYQPTHWHELPANVPAAPTEASR
jgi:hypothetical protein